MSNEILCLWCKYFWFDMGDSGYSDETPGYDACFNCRKDYWELSNYGSVSEFREHMKRAEKCKDFERDK